MNDLRSLQELLKHDAHLIDKRDSCGGTIIHAAYMYEQYNICHWLVKTYPEKALHPFSQEVALPSENPIMQNSKAPPVAIENVKVISYEGKRTTSDAVQAFDAVEPSLWARFKEFWGFDIGNYEKYEINDTGEVTIDIENMPFTGTF